jgi:outer membrane protein assembly factor BamD (BamD/ComL family)
LGRGDHASALDAVSRHAEQYPSGRLTEEREAIAIQALARSGAKDEARARAERFERSHPSSLFAPAIARALRE